ncbi:DNA/RNA non-specific endonuclease [Alistipes putredinis]|uniref:DNA/RNA non-specific endonuclease n=1 Tax=Alistipes putredinis TaxID=28117 RepID=UPI003AAA476A
MAAPRHACYEVKGTDRTDAYSRDPDIPSGIQYSSKSTGGGCNKGHMLGSAERLVTRKTNEQVFYYSNIAPQYSSNFNNGGGAWNNLESFVDAQVCADTTYIVVGTYFEPFTDAYGKSCTSSKIDFGGRSDVSRPSMFYYLLLRTKNGNTKKSVMDCAASELKCAAFVLRHNMDKGHEPQAKDMMSVAEIERLTGFTFFANVPNAPKDTYNPSDWGL